MKKSQKMIKSILCIGFLLFGFAFLARFLPCFSLFFLSLQLFFQWWFSNFSTLLELDEGLTMKFKIMLIKKITTGHV